MFTIPEKKLIDKKYFEIIRETDDFIELKSKNTHHCWIIQKHQFDDKRKIYLYHKHSMKNRYYHHHYKTFTVRQAVEDIKGHDEYVLKYAYH